MLKHEEDSSNRSPNLAVVQTTLLVSHAIEKDGVQICNTYRQN